MLLEQLGQLTAQALQRVLGRYGARDPLIPLLRGLLTAPDQLPQRGEDLAVTVTVDLAHKPVSRSAEHLGINSLGADTTPADR